MKKSFIEFCIQNKFEKNQNQIDVIEALSKFYYKKKNIYEYLFNKNKKIGFYLYGDVGVGKTMLLNYFFEKIDIPKKRLHFNQFMINFHNYRHKHKNDKNTLKNFVKNFKKETELIYFDEFQITNIVDAMILGKLFEVIFTENIKIIITSNIKLDDLYKDGLQRDQFLPFISIIKKYSLEKKLIIKDDYRINKKNNLRNYFYPLDEKSHFKINQLFRDITKGKRESKKIINIKGRDFTIKKYFEGKIRFDFDDLCGVNLGAEDYIKLCNNCDYLIIENIPNFNEENSNKQNRFITLDDILYEKKILLAVSASVPLEEFKSSLKLEEAFKRTISRIHELTSLS